MDAVRSSSMPHRLNVLLNDPSQDWAIRLPQLLEPQGIRAIRVDDVDQALRVIESEPIHAAVVDLGLPTGSVAEAAHASTGGLKLLRVIQRLQPAPPTVVVRGRRFESRTDDRMLRDALKLQAFSVLDQPVDLEQMLRVLQRLLHRFYAGQWPV